MASPAENAALIVVGSGSIFTAIVSTWLVLAPPAILGPQGVETTKDAKAKPAKAVAKDKAKDEKPKDEKPKEDDKDEEEKTGAKIMKPLNGPPPGITPPRLPTNPAPTPVDDPILNRDKTKPLDRNLKDAKPRVGGKRKDTDGPPAPEEKPE